MKLSLMKMMALFVLVGALASPAHAVQFSIVGAGVLGKPTLSQVNVPDTTGTMVTDPTSNSKLGFGGGVLADFMLGQAVGLETGALYLMRKYEFSNLGFSLTETSVQVPLLLRFRLGHAVSIGVGGYAASGLGKLKASSAGGESEETYGDAGLLNLDYGAVGSVALKLPLGSTSSFLIDGRYTMGLDNRLSDRSNGVSSWKNNDIQILAGIQFGGGHK